MRARSQRAEIRGKRPEVPSHSASGESPGLAPRAVQSSKFKVQGSKFFRLSRLSKLFLCFPILANAAVVALQPPGAPVRSDPTVLQCGNLIYCGNKSSVCFADRFLTEVMEQTCLRVNRKFCPVRLDSDALFDFPFCVMSGNENFLLSEKERAQLRKFLSQGGFLLVSPGCSDEKWDQSFRQELRICFPEHALGKIPLTHPIFSIVNQIPRLTEKHGRPAFLEGLEIHGRLALVYSKEGLNDVEHAFGCCCCGGNEISNPERVNVNVFTYAVLY